MQARKRYEASAKDAENKEMYRTGGIDDACARYGLGKVSMRKVAEDAGAIVRIGRRWLVNYAKVDLYMDSISQ